MAHVVAEPCRGCRHTDCAVVCPCECFREGTDMLYIEPESCIDCGACVSECPEEAIFHQDDVPARWVHYVELNARMAAGLPIVTEKQPSLKLPSGH